MVSIHNYTLNICNSKGIYTVKSFWTFNEAWLEVTEAVRLNAQEVKVYHTSQRFNTVPVIGYQPRKDGQVIYSVNGPFKSLLEILKSRKNFYVHIQEDGVDKTPVNNRNPFKCFVALQRYFKQNPAVMRGCIEARAARGDGKDIYTKMRDGADFSEFVAREYRDIIVDIFQKDYDKMVLHGRAV